MVDYLNTKNDKDCCGCTACEKICPTQAIVMKEDGEGFLYPTIDSEKCINCGLCSKICPVMNKPSGSKIISCYAVQHKDEYLLKNSSSGGVFRLLADEFIKNGGYVVGCVFDDDNKPILKIANNYSDLQAMQGSKYVYSHPLNVYKEVEELLKNNNKVLFTGAPCQCASILNFLKKPYENLYTADFICHGMPSNKLFNAYVKSIEDKKGKISNIKFRDKEKNGWGGCFSYEYNNGKNKRYNVGKTDPYYYGYVSGYFNRYFCYECSFRGEDRFTDFTFCDFWGVNFSGLNKTKGVSAFTINSNKGNEFFEYIEDNATFIKADTKQIAIENPSLIYKSVDELPGIRKTIYAEIENLGFSKVAKKHLRVKGYFIKKCYYSLPLSFKKILRKLK